MNESALDVIDVSEEPSGALDCFQSEIRTTLEARPLRQPLDSARGKPPLDSARGKPRVAALRRSRQQRHLRERLEWPIRMSLFACGLLIGALLTGPAFPTSSAAKANESVALGPVLKPPATPTNVVAIRNEQGTAGSDSALAAVDSARSQVVDELLPAGRQAGPDYRGTLIVTSTPRGASVFVNGEWKGETPLELHRQSAGSRALRLDLDGYARWSRAINVVANDATIVSAHLSRVD